MVALTVGRRCRRGRLDEDGRRDDGVRGAPGGAGSREQPPQVRLLLRRGPGFSSGAAAPVSFFSFSSSSPSPPLAHYGNLVCCNYKLVVPMYSCPYLQGHR